MKKLLTFILPLALLGCTMSGASPAPRNIRVVTGETPKPSGKKHTYTDVYGRMFPNEPSQTITTGFLSPGRGRYIHPVLPRGLTLREGARLQSFPDDYQWLRRGKELRRNPLAALIGDAVPPQLGFTVGLMGLALM